MIEVVVGPSKVNSREPENELHVFREPLYLTITYVVKSWSLPSACVLCKSRLNVTSRSMVSEKLNYPNWRSNRENAVRPKASTVLR